MSTSRRCCFFTLVLITSWLMAACGDDPPNKELQQAQQAIDAARTSGAERYATDEFTASQDALKHAQAAVVARDYRQALNDALDARDRAQTASKDTVDRKATAKVDADRGLHDAALAIVDARAKLRGADASRRASKPAAALRRDVADAETHVQEARTAFDKGNFLDASELIAAPMQRLTDSVRALDNTAPPAARRRR
jgi:hypothetical protein